MNSPAATKTEHRALNALETVIDEHLTMDYQFNGNDKEMSWDGYIWLFQKNNGDVSKENLDGRVPVQIKGHHDTKQQLVGKKRIKYPVSLADLEAYATEKGVLYFQIFMNGSQKDIYYASLFPSRILDYLELAKQRKNKTSIRVAFNRLETDANKLYVVAKQFHDEATKQGSAYNELVQDRIRVDEFEKIDDIRLNIVGVADPYDALKRLDSGDVCLYGKTKDDKYFRPLEMQEKTVFRMGHCVKQPISIEGEIFYEEYNAIADSKGGIEVHPSPNLTILLTETEFKFTVKSSLKELYQDARFLLKLKEKHSLTIAQQELHFINVRYTDSFESKLRYLIDLYETVNMIGLDVESAPLKYTDEQEAQLLHLVKLRLGAYNNQLQDGLSRYVWRFGSKSVPLLIAKENNKIELTNAVYQSKYEVFLPGEESADARGYKMPMFAYQDVTVLSNLYLYDYNALKKQIDGSSINKYTSAALLQAVLLMINVFDNTEDVNFLDLADYLLQKLMEPEEIMDLNRIQIKKRRGTFGESDIKTLLNMKSKDAHILFGINVLLGAKERAHYYYNQLSKEDQKTYKSYPIYKLFERL